MPKAHAVLFVSSKLRRFLKDAFLPVWEIRGNESLNDLWVKNGRFSTDVYAYGNIAHLTIRQLRGHGFLFIATKHEVIQTRDGGAPHDVEVNARQLESGVFTIKDLETTIGRTRVQLRRNFGDCIRIIALRDAEELHGSEAETLMQCNPRIHKVYGLPRPPPAIGLEESRVVPFRDDQPTDEKLVAMLDYFCYSSDKIIYIGCGDLRTLEKFEKKDPLRFSGTKWICIDPIVPETRWDNVQTYRFLVQHGSDIQKFRCCDDANPEEVSLIWDVRSDRGLLNDSEWEEEAERQDRLGEHIAWMNREWLHLALIKMRIPTRDGALRCLTSCAFPQPGADSNLFELRNLLRLYGFSHVDRTHIPIVTELDYPNSTLRSLVLNFHGKHRGKQLKRSILEFLHITPRNGLNTSTSPRPRADLFYLTNRINESRREDIFKVLERTRIGTVWVGDQIIDYDDFSMSSRELMLRLSRPGKMVLDGNGFMLFSMWRKLGNATLQTRYDPWWAAQFAVVVGYKGQIVPVPDVSLCRFIGLRQESSLMRVRGESVHRKADLVKSLGLDLSGHLYMCLMSNCYVADLHWWFRMILEWSVLSAEGKKEEIKRSDAELIEWKEEKASTPWHLREDLIAALKLAREHHLPDMPAQVFDYWLEAWANK
uniref:Core protein VP4 n=1 Tax=Skunk River virus TaxID=2488682 RepID=A0A3S8RBX8_9REOV|nr:VP4 [Skunk River virus]